MSQNNTSSPDSLTSFFGQVAQVVATELQKGMAIHEGRYHEAQGPKGQGTSVPEGRKEAWPMKGGRISSFRAWEEGTTDSSWQSRTYSLGIAAWEGSGAGERSSQRLRGLIAELAKQQPDLADEIEETITDHSMNVMEFAVVLGYALARTYPASMDAMDGWVEDAMDFAQLRGFPHLARKADDEEIPDENVEKAS